MRPMFRIVVIALIGAVAVAYVAGRAIGYRSGFRQGRTQEVVKLAGYLTEELNGIRHEGVPDPRTVVRWERLLQTTLIGLMWNISPTQLATDDHLMQAMHYVRTYRQMFPYGQETGLGVTNSLDSLCPTAAHAKLHAFLDALPQTDEVTQRRIESHFTK